MTIIHRIDGGLLSSSTLSAAYAWARRGVKVLATHGVDDDGRCDCGAVDCKSPGKHPIASEFPHGHKSATTDIIRIFRVFRKYPNANLAIVPPPGMIAVDVDGRKGRRSFRQLKWPKTAKEKTGRGEHYLYRADIDLPAEFRNLDGIDIKTHNGYLVTSPSKHPSGRRYRFDRRASRRVARLSSKHMRLGKTDTGRVGIGGPTLSVSEGSRNETLTSFAGYLRHRGLSARSIDPTLQALNGEICVPPLEPREVERIAYSVGNYPTLIDDAFGTLADVEAQEVRFLIDPYIVLGATTVLDGLPGVGKSTFTTAIAAQITAGKQLPFAEELPSGSTLFMSAEDDPARILRPRLEANGADVDKVRFQNTPFTLDAQGLDLLRSELSTHRPVLVVIDPIIAYMDTSTDGNNANDTMHFMVEIDLLAREFDAAIVVVRHLRKARADAPIYQGVGSIAMSARVRSGLLLGRHPTEPHLRAVAHSKSNYAPEGPTILFELMSAGRNRTPRVKWHGTTHEISPDDLLAATDRGRGRPDNEREWAKEFLSEKLRRGPVNKADIDQMANVRGISNATLRRAAQDLGIVKTRDGNKHFWQLPKRVDAAR